MEGKLEMADEVNCKLHGGNLRVSPAPPSAIIES